MAHDYPVLSAGGIADAADVRARLDAGAEAVVCGTRFLMTEESGGHPAYKARLVEAHETILTELFGVGWPAPHRVVPNEATDALAGPGSARPGAGCAAFHRATAPRASAGAGADADPPRGDAEARAGRCSAPPRRSRGGPPNLVEAGPLYAGECIDRISDIRPAGELVRELAA